MRALDQDKQATLLAKVFELDYQTLSCPACGGEVGGAERDVLIIDQGVDMRCRWGERGRYFG
ncbi:ribosomal L5 domain protein [Ralstonia insidiosa]|uniref:Ribosomal L5 domain protein n=1 Tax=Ralstonia insidiosa TaxID=190721 RepID=A0AAC9BM37_9RALS|nr:ribosomal L5 domain protein [Ralstonia insidiosa]GAQ29279.1 hypothetical protein SAMD00023378_2962 [Ralstonia sp. NT80]